MVPIIISIPSMIRLRQCLIEFSRVRKGPKNASTGWGGQHLANALKYSTAFPVIILSALQRGTNPNDFGMSEAGLFRLWYSGFCMSIYGVADLVVGCSSCSSTHFTRSIGMLPKIGT